MLQLGMIGFSDGFRHALTIALKNRANCACALVSLQEAEAILVDIDSATEQEYLRLRLHKKIPMLAISAQPESLGERSGDFAAVLPKPLPVTRLLVALNEVTGSLSPDAPLCATQNSTGLQLAQSVQVTEAARQIASRTSSASQVARASGTVKIDEFLLGLVYRATRASHSAPIFLVQWPRGDWLAIDWARQTVNMSLKPKILRSIALLPWKQQGLKALELTAPEFARLRGETVTQMELEEFLWWLTYWTVRTDLVDVLDTDQVYRLTGWPNLTRYSVSDMDIPLANHWVDRPNSVANLSLQLNIPEEKVLPFAACCLIAGFLQQVDSSRVTANGTRTDKKNGLRRVLGGMLARLSQRG